MWILYSQLTELGRPFDVNDFNRLTRDYAKVSDIPTKRQMCYLAHIVRERALSTKVNFVKFQEIVGACKAKARQNKETIISLIALIAYAGNSRLQGTREELKLKIAFIQLS